MPTIRQIEANRRNSQKSTGPRTVAGKAVSRMNALKSGIDARSQTIRGEDPEELQALTASYYDSLNPTRPEEALFVDAIIAADWLLRRLRRVEAETWNSAFEGQDEWSERYEEDVNQPLARAFEAKQDSFTRLQRRIDAAQRTIHRSFAELRRLRDSRPHSAQPSASPSSDEPKPKIGFVPPPSQTDPAEPFPAPISQTLFSAPTSASPRLCVEKHGPLSPNPSH